MSKIYEALEQAYRARAGSDKLVTVPHMSKIFTDQPQINVEEEMLCLYNNIDSLLPNIDKRIIQFIGSRQGEGTSTIVREFAKSRFCYSMQTGFIPAIMYISISKPTTAGRKRSWTKTWLKKFSTRSTSRCCTLGDLQTVLPSPRRYSIRQSSKASRR